MGRGWYRLGGGGGGEVSSCNSQRRSRSHESSNAASGCMAALFQFLDFHHFYFPSHHHHHHPAIDSLPKHPRGLVPPRNILELTEESPLSTTYEDKELLSIPMGFKVKTGGGGGATRLRLRAHALETSSSSSEMGNSPGTKTPNLVARLMGLDLLPDDTHSSPDLLHVMPSHRPASRIACHRLSLDSRTPGTRSLPESPRVSSSRKSDFDIHRLSLHLSKENKYEELGCSRLRELKKQEDESRSPRAYARQILNQIKERVVTRRIGMDVTNTVKNREAEPWRKHNELKRNSAISCPPSDGFPEKENKPSIKQKTPSPSTSRPDHHPMIPSAGKQEIPKRVKQQQLRPIKRCKEGNGEAKSTPRPKRPSLTSNNIQNKQEDVFISAARISKAKHCSHLDKKRNKKTHVSNDLVNISVASPIVPVKKAPSPPATKLPQKQVNESQSRGRERNSKPLTRHGQTYKHEDILLQVARTPKLDNPTAIAATSTTTGETEINVEQEYVTRMLSYAGIRDTVSPVSSATWFSHTHPLDLSIFRNLEHLGKHPSGPLALRCNRRLIFDLANEILVVILNPHTRRPRNYNGSELVGKLCASIASYTCADFLNSKEIDALFVGKLPETTKVEEEGEGIVEEIERDMVEALVEETTSYLYVYNTKRRRI